MTPKEMHDKANEVKRSKDVGCVSLSDQLAVLAMANQWLITAEICERLDRIAEALEELAANSREIIR